MPQSLFLFFFFSPLHENRTPKTPVHYLGLGKHLKCYFKGNTIKPATMKIFFSYCQLTPRKVITLMAGQDENWSQEAKYMEECEFLKDRIRYEKNSRKLSSCVKLTNQVI